MELFGVGGAVPPLKTLNGYCGYCVNILYSGYFIVLSLDIEHFISCTGTFDYLISTILLLILDIIPYSLDVSYVDPKRPNNTLSFSLREKQKSPKNEKKTEDEDQNEVLIDRNRDLI